MQIWAVNRDIRREYHQLNIRGWNIGMACLAGLVSPSCTTPNEGPQVSDRPYEILRDAYADRDAGLASSAYAHDATLRYFYEDDLALFEGQVEIRGSFQSFFDSISSDVTLDLNFRISDRFQQNGEVTDKGIYRLDYGGARPSYGRFQTIRSAEDSSVFRYDESATASELDFELIKGPVLASPDSDGLTRRFHERFQGRYAGEDGCIYIITQSVVRLFLRNSCTNQWTGLSRINAYHWEGGASVLSGDPVFQLHFDPPSQSVPERSPQWLEIRNQKNTVRAHRTLAYNVESTSFKSVDDVELKGDLYLPERPNGYGTVMVHGSGPQDRNGYASIIAVLADELAASGTTVLLFDKRGVGGSSGDWSASSFSDLAADVRAGMNRMSNIPGVETDRIGVAGSSQAGWVVAKMIADGGSPEHVLLLGAAGSAMTVPEQNLYNTKTRMKCSGISPNQIDLALRQQSAFFDYVISPNSRTADQLSLLTIKARNGHDLQDWLFPVADDFDLASPDWFNMLELDFDPLPVWQDYQGRAAFIFAEYDDSTPTEIAVHRLERLNKPKQRAHVLKNAQHIGLVSRDTCNSSLAYLSTFHPDLFPYIKQTIAPINKTTILNRGDR